MALKDFIEAIGQLYGEMYHPMELSFLYMNICKEYLLRKMKRPALRFLKS